MEARKLVSVLLLLALWSLGVSAAVAAEPAVAEPEPEEIADAAAVGAAVAGTDPGARSALLPRTENIAAQLMPLKGTSRGLDGYQWLDVAQQQGLLVHRAAYHAPGKGVALLVSADIGAHSGATLLGQLRQTLPATDWHSYLVGLPLGGSDRSEQQDQVLLQRVTQAIALLKTAHPTSPMVVLAEGSVCASLAALFVPDGALSAAGLVLLNQPPPQTTDGALGRLETPTLMLQVLPNRYPPGYPLAQAVELRQLPRVSPRQPKSLVVRQVQGWLRQFEEPQPPLG